MSRGFVREGDQEEVPMVPQRAYLPPGVPNYVTPAGMEQLLQEREALINEREQVTGNNENERRIAVNHINARLNLLNGRIAEARVIDGGGQRPGQVRFGATVTLKEEATGETRTFQITGVDEADIAGGKISFISPLARALMSRKKGEKAALKTDGEEIIYEIIDIA